MTEYCIYEIAIFSPLVGFIIAGLAGKRLGGDRFSQYVTCGLMGCAVLASLKILITYFFGHETFTLPLGTWIQVGDFDVSWGLRLDALSSLMIFVVNSVSFLVHVYSIGYMNHDHSVPRFMAYLSLFTFAMLMLVASPNLIQLFFGWEGVGLASYLLIGFWHHKNSANAAAIKAFVMNRVGDFGLILGICATFYLFDTVEFDGIFAQITSVMNGGELALRPEITFLNWSPDAITLICILFFIGAMGKSAQLGLHTWLPDAMEGPTPVSALIHAATMVTAGVFLVCRMSPLFEQAPMARELVCIVGAVTALFAATIALTQTDIKRVIAYSTCSQLGYMFFAAGCSAYSAAMFHLTTHAFFKALLFLGAGSVIHAMSDEQDMRKMGGVYRMIPYTYAIMWIGSLAIAGIPFFAGFYSKDVILESAFVSGLNMAPIAFNIGIVVAVLTAFYSWRLLLMTFHGSPKADEKVMAHVHDAPITMKIPLLILSIGAILSGFLLYDFMVGEKSVWGSALQVLSTNNPLPHIHYLPMWVKLLPLWASILGISIAYLFYGLKPKIPEVLASVFSSIYKFLLNKWYFDELYEKLIVRPLIVSGILFWQQGDKNIIDRYGPEGIASLTLATGRNTGRLQTGYIYHYAFAMIIGLVLITSWYLYGIIK